MTKPDTKPPEPSATETPAQRLLAGVHVVNVGLAEFAADLKAHGTPATHVAWSPPAQGDAKLARLLAKLGS